MRKFQWYKHITMLYSEQLVIEAIEDIDVDTVLNEERSIKPGKQITFPCPLTTDKIYNS